MSIVVAVRHNGRSVMASDTQTNFGAESAPPDNHASTKVRRVGSSLLGRTGWGVYDNILEEVLAVEDKPDLGSSAAVFRFFNRMWKVLHERYAFVNDQSSRKDSPFGDLGGSFLVLHSDGIDYVSRNIGVSRFEKYYAIGSGADYALGALYQLYEGEDDALALARRAVETAIALNVHCGGEIRTQEL